MLLPESLFRQAEQQTDQLAIVDGGRSTTFGELAVLVSSTATRLSHTTGAAAVSCSTLTGTTVAILASLATGRMFIPIDQRNSISRIEYILDSTRATTVLMDGEHLPIKGCDFIDVLQTTSSRSSISLATSPEDQHAYALYTSGSTGGPKQIRHRRETLEAVGENFRHEMQLQPGERLAVAASLSHDAVLVDIAASISAGATMVRLDVLNPRIARYPSAWLSEHEISVVHCVPTVARRLLSRMSPITDNLGYAASPRAWVLGGEAVSEELLATLTRCTQGADVYLLYGQTECSIISMHKVCGVRDADLLGRPVDHVRWRLTKSDGQVSRILVSGPLVSLDAPIAEGVYSDTTTAWRETGDLVRMTLAGVRFVGRADDMVKVRGERISRLELESILRTLTDVHDAAVVVIAAPEGGRLCALLECTPGVTPILADINSAITEALGSWACLHLVRTSTEKLPTLASGKMDRRKVAELFSAE